MHRIVDVDRSLVVGTTTSVGGLDRTAEPHHVAVFQLLLV